MKRITYSICALSIFPALLAAQVELVFTGGSKARPIEIVLDQNRSVILTQDNSFIKDLDEGSGISVTFQDENKQPLQLEVEVQNNVAVIELIDPATSELFLMQPIELSKLGSRELIIPLDLEVIEHNGMAQARPTQRMLQALTKLGQTK